MVIPERMQENSAHCGPVAIAHRLGIKAAQVMVDWPDKWTDHRTDRKWWLWPIDTPWNHRAYVERIGRKFIELDEPQVGAIALIHNMNAGRNPITRVICGLLYQHWVRIIGVTDSQIIVDWGTEVNPTRIFDKIDFRRMTHGSWPTCIYLIS